MEINKIFKDEKEGLLERIENLPVFNCIKNFESYLNVKADSDFERKYIIALDNNIIDLAKEIIIKHYESLSKEELLNKLVIAHIDSPYSFYSYYDNNELSEFFDNYGYNDADAHELIKEYMLNQYKILVNKLRLTNKEERMDSIVKSIEDIEKVIKDKQKKLIDLRNELVELDEEE